MERKAEQRAEQLANEEAVRQTCFCQTDWMSSLQRIAEALEDEPTESPQKPLGTLLDLWH